MTWQTTLRALLLASCCLWPGLQVQAATYTLPASSFAPCQGGAGNWNSTTNTCSGSISFNNGDVLTSSSTLTLIGTGGITLRGNSIGTSSNRISLQSSSNDIVTAGSNATTLYGSVLNSSGKITLSNVTLNGSLQTSSGAVSLTSSSVSGTATGTGSGSLTNTSVTGNVRFDNGLTISGGTFSGTVSTNTTASFTGGTIAGAVTAPNGLTANGTTFSSSVSSNNDVTLTGGSVVGTLMAGKLVATGGTVFSSSITVNTTANLTGGSVAGNITSPNGLTTSNTDLTGNVKATNGATSITGGTLSGNIEGNCCKITLSGAYMTGSITSSNEVELSSSSITGNITTDNTVTFSNSTVYGNVKGASWSTITGTGSSKVYGTCNPSATSPTTLCDNVSIQSCLSDNFNNRTDLGSDWAVTSRSGSFGTPTIVNGRMRLTDNSGDVATASTLQRLLPATGNFVQVQFRYYAYGGNGADGVAVVLSDASFTPQPGAFGGPLGYGTKNTAATTGFAGGWLGVGIDEYGNFSNEGGTNSVGQRQDSVAVRGSGSGTSGYPYLRGTAANLNPGIDISGSTPGPGHLYRITLDSTTAGKTMVTVERNTGSGFTTLISSFDARASASQAALPSNFYLSLTGSTGGSNNIHELDDLQVCATKINPIGAQIDHYEFSYSSPALTCSPQPVTIKACLNSSCSSLYTDPVSVQLSPSSGWTVTAPATISGSTITFSGGTATAQLRSTAVGDVVVGTVANTSVPATKPLSTPVCSTSGCTISYADSGFLITVPNMIAVKPVTGSIKAVKKDDTSQACVPGFASVTRSLSFTSGYSNPTLAASTAAGVTTNQPVVVNGSNVTTSATSLSLAFDATGSAPLTVRYDDAGLMTLSASYTGSSTTNDAGLSMTGSTTFKSRPYGLCLQTDSTCTVAGVSANCVAFPGGIRAGDSFPLRINAVGWQADGEALTAAALCTGNIVTPKFELSSIALSSALVEPAGGASGSVTPASYSHVLGNQTTASMSVSEVGVFRFTATPSASNYLGTETVSGGTSDLVGRFIPAYLGAAGSASLTPSCGSAYSYQGQPIAFASGQEPLLTVTGYNRQGAVTSNYDRGAFWRLNTPTRDAYLSVISGRTNLNSRLSSQGTVTATTVDASTGDGYKAFRWSGEQLLYSPASVPVSDDYPVAASIRQGFSAAALTDLDGACYLGGGSTCTTYSFDFGGSNVRLGRLRIGNARGSELQSLTLPVTLETWQSTAGGSFQAETQDTCTTAAVLGAVTLDNYTGNLSAGKTTPTSIAPVSGSGSLQLSAPGSGYDGSVQARYSTQPSWLYFAWDGTTRSEARGLASFGIYKGAPPLIFRRELYR